MTNETTPDAVAMLQWMHACVVHSENHGDVPRIGSDEVLAVLRATQDERARHAEEVARLEAAHLSDLETIEAWKLASGLECGGDPDGVTPAGMRRYWEGVEADRDSLRDQLRRVEGERDALAVRMDLPASQLLMVGSELCGDGKIDPNDHRDPRWTPTLQQAAKVMRELTALRSLLPDVRACARFTYRAAAEGQLVPEFSSAQKLLAADFLREGGE